MSKFWQRKYISKYSGAEIDAAVARAGTVPAVTEADAGKALVVDEEGKIVTSEPSGGDIVFVHISHNDQDNLVADKTFVEIATLIDSGKIVNASYDNKAFSLFTGSQQAISFLSPVEGIEAENKVFYQSIISINRLNVVSIQYISTTVTSITIES